MRTEPEVGVNNPQIRLIRLVLPHPEGPWINKRSALRMFRSGKLISLPFGYLIFNPLVSNMGPVYSKSAGEVHIPLGVKVAEERIIKVLDVVDSFAGGFHFGSQANIYTRKFIE